MEGDRVRRDYHVYPDRYVYSSVLSCVDPLPPYLQYSFFLYFAYRIQPSLLVLVYSAIKPAGSENIRHMSSGVTNNAPSQGGFLWPFSEILWHSSK